MYVSANSQCFTAVCTCTFGSYGKTRAERLEKKRPRPAELFQQTDGLGSLYEAPVHTWQKMPRIWEKLVVAIEKSELS